MSTTREFLSSKAGLAACLLVAAIGVYLLWTHTGHVLSALPYLFLLACPLLHFIGHGGHGHEHGHGRVPPEGSAKEDLP
jgi:hypothetical protein